MNKTKVYFIPDDSLILYIGNVVGTIVRPNVGEYFIFGNNLLKIVQAQNCKNCFFYRNEYCKLMFIEKRNIHCEYDSKINFIFDKFIIDR